MSETFTAREVAIVEHFEGHDHAPESAPLCANCGGDGAWEELIDWPDIHGGTAWVVCTACDGTGKS